MPAENEGCWERGWLTHPKPRENRSCALSFHTWTAGDHGIRAHVSCSCSVAIQSSWCFPVESIRKAEGINKIINKFLSIIIQFLQIQLLLEPPDRINDMENLKDNKQYIWELEGSEQTVHKKGNVKGVKSLINYCSKSIWYALLQMFHNYTPLFSELGWPFSS